MPDRAPKPVLFDFNGAPAPNLPDFQVVREHLFVGPHGTLESASRAFFEDAKRGEGEYFDVLNLRFTDRGSRAAAILRSYHVMHEQKRSLPFVVPDDAHKRDYRAGVHRFDPAGETLEGYLIFDFSGTGLRVEGALVHDCPLPRRPEGMSLEFYGWWVVEEVVLSRSRSLGAERHAVCFGPEALEAAAVLRQSRNLNRGRPSNVYVPDESHGDLRLLRVWDRADAAQRRRHQRHPWQPGR